jgi:hypothetical protein
LWQQLTCVTTWCHCQMCWAPVLSCADKAWHLQHM